MAVIKGSRYEGAKLTLITLESGEVRPYVHDRQVKKLTDSSGKIVTVSFGAGKELDQISVKVRGKGKEDLWWEIADTNDIIFP